MPKKLKLNLNDLKVQSFVTALTDEEKNRFKGAGSDGCDSGGTALTHCTCVTRCTCTCQPSECSGLQCC